MSLEADARYFIEHKTLPMLLRKNRLHLLNLFIEKKGQAMRDLYAKLEDMNPLYRCPYTSDQFSISFRKYDNRERSVYILCIGMPDPEQPPLCRAVYLCFADDGYKDVYFTSELTTDGQFFLCAWIDSIHANYGDEDSAEFDRVAELFWEMHELADLN